MKVQRGRKGVIMELPNEDFTYGMPTKPTTPIKSVICNYYGETAEAEIQRRYAEIFKVVRLVTSNYSRWVNYLDLNKRRPPDYMLKPLERKRKKEWKGNLRNRRNSWKKMR